MMTMSSCALVVDDHTQQLRYSFNVRSVLPGVFPVCQTPLQLLCTLGWNPKGIGLGTVTAMYGVEGTFGSTTPLFL